MAVIKKTTNAGKDVRLGEGGKESSYTLSGNVN
jgi:hypothetical protein